MDVLIMTERIGMDSMYAYLQSKGYHNIKIVNNTQETIDCMRADDFDCVVLDVPLKSTLNFTPLKKVALCEIRFNKYPRFILIYDSDELIKALKRAGLENFLDLKLKSPVLFSQLLEAIQPDEPA